MTAAQDYGLQQTSNYANSAQPGLAQAQNMTMAGSGAANPTTLDQNAISQYMNPYEADVIAPTAALMQQQFGQAQSGALGNAVQSGAFGGDRAGIANANLQQQQGLAYGQTMGGLLNQNYGQALSTAQQQQGVDLGAQQANLQRLQQGAAQEGQLAQAGQQAGLSGAQALLGAGQVQQQTQQAGLTALYNQFLQQQSYPFQTAQFLANIAEGTGALSGQTTTTTQPMPFFSDRRLKEDIREIGKAKNGLPIYSFRYKDDPDKLTRIGFMADEVEKKHPEAVGLAGGYKTVDYDRAARAEGGLVGDLDQGETYGRGGYDDGGLVSPFNPWNQLDTREMQLESGEGGAGAATTSPYGGRGAARVPLAPFEHHALLQPGPIPRQPEGAGAQAMQGLGALEKLYDMGKSAQGMYHEARQGLGFEPKPQQQPPNQQPPQAGAAPPAHGSAPPPVSQGGPGPARETSDAGASAAPPDSGDPEATQVADAGLAAAGDAPPPEDLSDMGAGLADVMASARGGRIGRDVGGGLGVPSMVNAPVQSEIYDAAARQNALPSWGGPFADGGRTGRDAGGGLAAAPTAPFQGPDVVTPTAAYEQGLGDAQAAQVRANQVDQQINARMAAAGQTSAPDLTPAGVARDNLAVGMSGLTYHNAGKYTNPAFSGSLFARGGLAGREQRGAGGGLDVGQWNSADQEYQNDNPDATQDTTQLGIPDEQPNVQPLKPSTPPSQSGSGGLGAIGQGIGALTGLMGLFMSTGGRIGRDDGGRIFGFDPQQDDSDSAGERGARILAGYGDDGGDPAPTPVPAPPPPSGLAGRRKEDAAPDTTPDAPDVPLPPSRPAGLGASPYGDLPSDSEFSAHDPLDSVSMGAPNAALPNDYVGHMQLIEAGGYGESAPTRPTGLHGAAIAPDARIAAMPSAADPTGNVMAGASGYAPDGPSTLGEGSLMGLRAKAGLQPDQDVPLPPRRPPGLDARSFTAANAPKGAIPGDAATAIGKATDPSQWQGNVAPTQPNPLQQGANAIGAAGANIAHGLDEATRNVKNFFQAGAGNIDYARQYLASRGWSPGAVAGILGQLVNEGGGQLNPQAVGPGGDFGIAQWLDRKPQLIKFAAQNGWDYRRLDTQLAFLDHELRTTERASGDALQNAKTPYESAVAGIGYERPKGYSRNDPTRGMNWAGRYASTKKYWGG